MIEFIDKDEKGNEFSGGFNGKFFLSFFSTVMSLRGGNLILLLTEKHGKLFFACFLGYSFYLDISRKMFFL
jgi:hypothetical protein